jgi:hypothetical protein
MGAPIGGRIVGNLDCEASFAGRPGVRPRVEKAISALGTLLRAFAAGDDVLWVPHLVCFERMAEVPGLPQPCLESGHLEGMPPAGRVIAWG